MLSLLSLTSFLFTSNAIPCDVGEELYKCWDNNGAFELEYDQNCTYMDWICDEIADCPFGDDEWNCPTYEQCMTDTDNTGAPIGFGCDNTTCIYYSWSCLGGDVSVWDCPNQADVSQQTCQEVAGYTDCRNDSSKFICNNTNNRCIDKTAVCDEILDCLDGQDEDPAMCGDESNQASAPTTFPVGNPTTRAPTIFSTLAIKTTRSRPETTTAETTHDVETTTIETTTHQTTRVTAPQTSMISTTSETIDVSTTEDEISSTNSRSSTQISSTEHVQETTEAPQETTTVSSTTTDSSTTSIVSSTAVTTRSENVTTTGDGEEEFTNAKKTNQFTYVWTSILGMIVIGGLICYAIFCFKFNKSHKKRKMVIFPTENRNLKIAEAEPLSDDDETVSEQDKLNQEGI